MDQRHAFITGTRPAFAKNRPEAHSPFSAIKDATIPSPISLQGAGEVSFCPGGTTAIIRTARSEPDQDVGSCGRNRPGRSGKRKCCRSQFTAPADFFSSSPPAVERAPIAPISDLEDPHLHPAAPGVSLIVDMTVGPSRSTTISRPASPAELIPPGSSTQAETGVPGRALASVLMTGARRRALVGWATVGQGQLRSQRMGRSMLRWRVLFLKC